MAKVAFSAWQPGLYKSMTTSAGGSRWTRYLLDALLAQGHEVYWLLQEGPKPPDGCLPPSTDVDVAIVCWRWPMPDYPERDALYVRQMQAIRKWKKMGVPVLIHDEDHNIPKGDLAYLKKMGAILTAPELVPRDGFSTLLFPNPYYGRMLDVRNRLPFMTSVQFGYIGNSYDRFDQAVKYVQPISSLYKTVFWGNWLEDGPGKPGKEAVLSALPNVSFRGRVSENTVVENLMIANATIHLFKPSYGPVGFVTMRWAEAAAAATPAFLPSEFQMPPDMQKEFEDLEIVANDGADLVSIYNELTELDWVTIVLAQQKFVQENMVVRPWIAHIETLTKEN